MFEPIGHVILNDKFEHTDYFWGEMSDIAGQQLNVIEIVVNNTGYMCITLQGLVDVDERDCVPGTFFNRIKR